MNRKTGKGQFASPFLCLSLSLDVLSLTLNLHNNNNKAMASLLRQRCQVSIRQLGSLRPGRAPSGPRIWTGRRLAADFSAPKPPLPPPPSRGLLRRYTTLLETRPLTTKAVTAAILGFLGDAVAQLGVQVQLGVDPKQLTFDVKRSAIFTSFAGALAPVLHFWYVFFLVVLGTSLSCFTFSMPSAPTTSSALSDPCSPTRLRSALTFSRFASFVLHGIHRFRYLYLLRIGSQTIPGVLKRVALDQFGFAPIFFGFVLSFLTFAENRADTETESLINKWFDTLVL